ncbi:MAG: Lrp/AsnC ligand binding domain-containing protein [Nitrosarchaeum sp.]|nr:Lrp/AsnC ligand binding domain-containing protein [Nitrosarchaeum sp.]
MTQAFVLVTCEPNTQNDVSKKLRKITGISESKKVFGAYDCIAKTNDLPNTDIQNLVQEQIRTIDGIKSTLTLNKTEI